MRRIASVLLFSIGSLLLVLILGRYFPKYHGMLGYLMFYLIMDLYLWYSIKRTSCYDHTFLRILLIILFWLPLTLLVSMIIFGLFYSFIQWNITLRTWLISLIIVTFLSKTFPLLSLFISDVICFMKRLVRKAKVERSLNLVKKNRSLLFSGWIIGGICWIILVVGMIIGPYHFVTKNIIIPIQDLPRSLNHLRIVHISDIHLGSWNNKKELDRAVGIINSLNPDLILFSGDLFNFSTCDGFGFQPLLSKLQAKHGIFAVLGNHDYGDYIRWRSPYMKIKNMKDCELFYRRIGWTLLRNESALVEINGDTLALAGVENWGKAKRFQKLADLDRALKGINRHQIKILLAHDPTYWDQVVSVRYKNITLTLSGHTHGGQVGFMAKYFHFSPVSIFYPQWSGLYTSRDGSRTQVLYVNQGLGVIGYSGRVGIYPEITCLVLTKDSCPIK